MATNHATRFSERVKESLEQAQARLAALEEEAQRVVAASRKEITNLLQKLNAQDLLDVKEWSGRARHVGEDMGNRLDELRDRVITFMGVASREQVEELARDLTKLSRKLDRLATARPAARSPRAKAQ